MGPVLDGGGFLANGPVLSLGPAGLEVKFRVDPADLDPGESSGFLSYLMTHKLHIDVWDGESLMLLGSVAVPLQVGCGCSVMSQQSVFTHFFIASASATQQTLRGVGAARARRGAAGACRRGLHFHGRPPRQGQGATARPQGAAQREALSQVAVVASTVD